MIAWPDDELTKCISCCSRNLGSGVTPYRHYLYMFLEVVDPSGCAEMHMATYKLSLASFIKKCVALMIRVLLIYRSTKRGARIS